MWAQLKTAMHPDAVRLIIVLFLSFLIGLEREEHQSQEKGYSFGGVRTFPPNAVRNAVMVVGLNGDSPGMPVS